jgi:hypothetical protein
VITTKEKIISMALLKKNPIELTYSALSSIGCTTEPETEMGITFSSMYLNAARFFFTAATSFGVQGLLFK